MRKSVTHSAISLAVHAVLVYVMLDKLNWGVYGLVIGNVTFALAVCVLNWAAIGRTLGYRQEVKTTFLLPLFCSAVMGRRRALPTRGSCGPQAPTRFLFWQRQAWELFSTAGF